MYGTAPDAQPVPVVIVPPAPFIVPVVSEPKPQLVNGHAAPPAFGEPRLPNAGEPETPLDPGEAAAAADAAAEAEEFDDEGNLSLAAMEASLKPQVLETLDQIASLYKKLGKLQDAQVEGCLGADVGSTSQERRFQKLRNE